jgi:long-subunit acyl-CoA synthetase (AMP-forming)
MAPAAVLDDGHRRWRREALAHEAGLLAQALRDQGAAVVATLLDNGPAWVAADLAAAQAQAVHVPLPSFFAPEQMAHALRAAGVDTLLTLPQAAARWPGAPAMPCAVAGQDLVLVRLPAQAVAMPAGTAKITFTSGTTGAPKGVCLGAAAMQCVAAGLVEAMAPLGIARHLCALPLPVLLENIAGLLAPLSHGATCVVLPLAQLGWTGSSGFDAALFDAAVRRHQPDSTIVLPQMLRLWVEHLKQTGTRAPPTLKFVAVGGAAVGARLVLDARALGIPAYEGYGLSEGASVQALNLPGADRPGSVGRLLPHARARLAADGEIEIAGSLLAGYLGDAAPPRPWWPTGDLGRLDADGYLHVQGRKKHVLITAFGRNVSPEWVEGALRDEAGIAQAVVFGDGQPQLAAVLWPAVADTGDADLQRAVDTANAGLPDYARVQHWMRARFPFTSAAGMATANGRPQRAAILMAHAELFGDARNAMSQPECS